VTAGRRGRRVKDRLGRLVDRLTAPAPPLGW
jgi:hypothetical protein